MDHVDKLIPNVNSALVSVQAIETNTTRTEAELSGILNTTRHIAIDEHNNQAMQLHALQLLAVKAYSLMDDLDATTKQIGAIAPVIADTVRETGTDIHTTLYSSQKLLEATTDDVASPAIKQTLDNLSDATQGAKVATQEGAATMVTIHKGVDYEVGELMKPVKKAKAALYLFVTLAGRFFGFS